MILLNIFHFIKCFSNLVFLILGFFFFFFGDVIHLMCGDSMRPFVVGACLADLLGCVVLNFIRRVVLLCLI